MARLAWYRLSTNARRRLGAYLSIVVLTGLVGGVALGALAAARRTASSYANFLATTNPSDLTLNVPQGPLLAAQLGRLPGVARVSTALDTLNAFPASNRGQAIVSAALADGQVGVEAGLDGEFFTQDKVTVTGGRMAAPGRRDEFVTTALAAHILRWHIGQVVPMVFYTNSQSLSSKPLLHLRMTLVGTVVFNDEVLVDDVDRYPTFVLFTPALARPLSNGPQNFLYGLKLRQGPSGVPTVEREIIRALPPGVTYQFHVTSVVQSQVDRSIAPESTALAAFGLIALLVALVLAWQAISRHVQQNEDDAGVLRALGARPQDIVLDGLVGTLASVVLGATLAVGVAVALSPLSPLGPVRPVDPSLGIALDSTVLIGGGFLLMVAMSSAALAAAGRGVLLGPRRSMGRSGLLPSGLAVLAARLGAPVPALAGARLALEPGHGRTAVPVRSVLVANVLAVAIVVATLNFGSGLASLVSHPSLYGWNWDFALQGYPVPPQSLALLRQDPLVAAWSGVSFANVQVDGRTVPALLADADAKVGPTVLSGHALGQGAEVVLGGATLAQLHKRVGQSVLVGYGAPSDGPTYIKPTRLRIVGTAALPAVGQAQSLHTSMGTGAVVPFSFIPPAFRKYLRNPNPTLNGPLDVFVRLRQGASAPAGLASLRHIAEIGTEAFQHLPTALYQGQFVDVLPVQYPAEIENYRTIGLAPDLLAAGLSLGAGLALVLTLVASVRRRRRDLALLKVLGFTQSQVGQAVAWQSTISVAVGVLVGMPAGVALGRWTWDLFARSIYAVPADPVPGLSLLAVGVGALLLANLVAVLPGTYAARTPAGLVLRAE